MKNRTAQAISLLLCLIGFGCGEFERGNPYDPATHGTTDSASLLLGTWSRVDAEKNEVYIFRENRGVVLYDYAAGPGAETTDLTQLDRNAPYPATIAVIYSGLYTLTDNRLRMSFSDVITTDPQNSPPSLPTSARVVSVTVGQDQLIMEELDGVRTYTRMD